eukprot:2625984-Amphidinium_carterae.1
MLVLFCNLNERLSTRTLEACRKKKGTASNALFEFGWHQFDLGHPLRLVCRDHRVKVTAVNLLRRLGSTFSLVSAVSGCEAIASLQRPWVLKIADLA